MGPAVAIGPPSLSALEEAERDMKEEPPVDNGTLNSMLRSGRPERLIGDKFQLRSSSGTAFAGD